MFKLLNRARMFFRGEVSFGEAFVLWGFWGNIAYMVLTVIIAFNTEPINEDFMSPIPVIFIMFVSPFYVPFCLVGGFKCTKGLNPIIRILVMLIPALLLMIAIFFWFLGYMYDPRCLPAAISGFVLFLIYCYYEWHDSTHHKSA